MEPGMMFPFCNDFSQTLVYKIMLLWKNNNDLFVGARGDGRSEVDAVLSYIGKLSTLTRGVPQRPILCGFQEGGHDFSYPRFGPVDQRIHSEKKPELSPAEALNHLIREARERYEALCTVHINIWEGYDDSEWFDFYKEQDLLSRYEDGSYIRGWTDEANNRRAYQINLFDEWEKGLLKKRIDELYDTLPELRHSTLLYNDANSGYFCSPYHKADRFAVLAVFKKLIRYLRETYHADLTGEVCVQEQYGYIGQTLTLELSADGHFFTIGDTAEPMQLAPYLLCGGRGDGRTDDLVFGNSIQLEYDPYHEKLQNAQREFCVNTLPYFFLNSKLRLSYDRAAKKARFSDDVWSFLFTGDERELSPLFESKQVENVQVIRYGDSLVRIGTDLLVPVVWREKELMAYSEEGSSRVWVLPPTFADVEEVDLYTLDENGLSPLAGPVKLYDHTLKLILPPRTAVSIVPSGTDPARNVVTPSDAEADYAGADYETGGYWYEAYGGEGYDIFDGEKRNAGQFSFIGGELVKSASDASLLRTHTVGNRNFYPKSFQVRQAPLHFLMNMTLLAKKRVSLYMLDADSAKRVTLIEVLDQKSGRRLAHTVAEHYEKGAYVTFAVRGEVSFRFTRIYGENLSYSGEPSLGGVFVDAMPEEPQIKHFASISAL